MKSSRYKKLIMLILSSVMLFSLAGCNKAEGDPVSVQSVSMITGVGSVGLVGRYSGVVVSGSTQEIKLEENMTVDEIKVKVGDEVKRGDILFTYDNELSLLNLEQAKLELEGLRNTLTANKEQVSELEKERSKAPSSQKLRYSLEIQELEASIREGEYNIAVKEKEVQRQEQATKNTQVKSVMDGRVSAINQPGDNSETDEFGAAKPFMTIIETGKLRIKGTINELNRGSITEGMTVTIRSRTDSTVTWTGTIDSVDWENPVSGGNEGYYSSSDEMTSSSKYPFYVTLEDYEGMFMGQHVYIEPGSALAEDTEMWLPEYYIIDADSNPWVWAASLQDKLVKRNLTLGEYDEENGAYLVLDGLATDDYIAFPDESLKAGLPVERYDEEMFTGEDGEESFESEEFAEGMPEETDGMAQAEGTAENEMSEAQVEYIGG